MVQKISKQQSEFVLRKAESHTPPYKIHRYFARRPWNLFQEIIERFSDNDDIILDPFCGGGVTIYEAAKLHRRVVGCDLNPLSTFIVRNMFYPDVPEGFLTVYHEVLNYLGGIVSKSFQTHCPKCKKNTSIHWYDLAHTVMCNKCKSKINLIDGNKERNGIYKCNNPDCRNSKIGFPVAKSSRQKPVYLKFNGVCEHCNNRFSGYVSSDDKSKIDNYLSELKKLVSKIDTSALELDIPLNWDRQKEDLLYEKGFIKFQDLFTEKNFLINVLLLDKIKQYKKQFGAYQILRFIFSSSLRDTNIMTFSTKRWQNGKPNTWAIHAYWTPAEFCEVNPFFAFSRSFQTLSKSILFNKKENVNTNLFSSFSKLSNSNEGILLKTGTVNDLKLPDDSIDVIITDPPYGSNVQYLELSHFWYMWNKEMYDKNSLMNKREAVVTRKLNHGNSKTYSDYEENLFYVFKECHRILKKDAKMLMTFNNKDLNSWLALFVSIFRAGFHFKPEGITFQDGVSHYKTTSHTKAKGSPYGDFVYEFTNTSLNKKSNYKIQDFPKDLNLLLEKSKIDYENGRERSKVVIELFNGAIPRLENFINSNHFENTHDIYNRFNKKQLDFLYK